MLYEKKKITLKDGREAVLKAPDPSEAAAMLRFLKTLASETEFILRYPEECTETDEQEAAFLESVNQSPTDLMIVCTVDGEIAGNCQISFHKRQKIAHRADIAIGVLQKYWGLGIGTALLAELERAAERKGILQLELEYIEGNERGKALYEKTGFVPVGERPDAIRLRDGSMRNIIMMIKRR